MLREYQTRTITELYAWFEAGNEGNPCLVLPTGSGKSHIIAALCKDALQSWPETRVLMLTHVKELIVQNAEKMRQHWPNCPLGIYSAGLGRKELGEPITFAGIQSVRSKAKLIGHCDLVIIDECFVAGTKISTPKGQIDIDKVRCGDLVFNTRGVGTVEAVSCRSVLETLLVELDNGTKFECTGNHPIFTDSGWRQAEKLEIGTPLFRIEDMSCLWSRVQTLDQKGRQRKSNFSNVGTILEKAELLLREVCKEITPDGAECRSTQTNAGNFEKNQASTYSTWRKRAIASFATVSASSCVRGRMDSRICNQDQSGTFERDISECVQGGHLLSGKDDLHRIGWGESRQRREENAGQKERPISCGPRVARVSRIKRESPVLVFNLQVSGHPSYFANGIAAHNCHLIGHKDEGGYRTLLSGIYETNPNVRVIGLTATPYRLGHGYITDKPAIFDALIEPVSIEELIFKGYLSTLRSKLTATKLEVDGVKKRGGEYIEAELQAKVDTTDKNSKVVAEIIKLGAERKSWLIFCAGVAHANHIKDALIEQGIVAECVTGDTPSAERDRILREFKAGIIKALTNCSVLTTGFDAPGIDLIAMLRPTMSPGLYVQMAGRGLRIAEGKTDCLVLDFAGVVEQHGPITAVRPPPKKGDKVGEAPVKVCDNCQEICALSVRVCPACGAEFPEPAKVALKLSNLDIMGLEGVDMEVTAWTWRKHISRASGKEMLSLTFYGGLSDPPVTEYLAVTHDGYAGEKSRRLLADIAYKAGVVLDYGTADLHEMAQTLTEGQPPSAIEYKKSGKFFTVLQRTWI
jgi:DNA repair protein RadD